MHRFYRFVFLPSVLLGGAFGASCAPNAPPVQNCEVIEDPPGVFRCVDEPGGSGGSGNATSGSGGSGGGLPHIGSGGVVTGVGGLPTLGGGNTGSGGEVQGGGGSIPGTGLGSIEVSAGALARDHSIVTFPFPAGNGKTLVLKDAGGATIPLQMSPLGNGNATFVLPTLAAGATATFTIEESAPLPDAVTAVEESSHLFLKHGATNIFRWVLVTENFRGAAANNERAGYIFPLYTPSGKNVADDYQVDHPHMHGVWSAWTSTTFRDHPVDFWNGYANQGHVDLAEKPATWNGPVHGGLLANLKHTDITVTPAAEVLNEVWVVTVYKTHADPSPYYVFDVDSTQVTAGVDKLVLEQFHYGGFGFRGSEEWQTACDYLTSEGHTRANGDGQRADWVAQYGTVGGAVAGYAALGHPTNIRTPQGIRIHPSNPYWSFTPTTSLGGGRYEIAGGGAAPLNSRFRLVTFDGAADAAFLQHMFDDYATPPEVTVLP